MSPDRTCDAAQLELSGAHDEGRKVGRPTVDHAASCAECSQFSEWLADLDRRLNPGATDLAPDLIQGVMRRLQRSRRGWWSVAAAAVVGVLIGSVVGGIGSRLGVVEAQDLNDRLHTASPSVEGLTAQLLVVERGIHPDVDERVYVGSLEYGAPEQLAIELVDATTYPSSEWRPNNVRLAIADGSWLGEASSRCPVGAMPGCLQPASARALEGLRPFDEGVLVPLEIIGPARSLAWWSGIEVVGEPTLDGRSTIQLETTVAAADLIRAITDAGAWRELHPTDRVLMWLDAQTLVPVRIEVFAGDSPTRELWQLRRGYDDGPSVPIFIIQLDGLNPGPVSVDLEIPQGSPVGGFIDGPATTPEPILGPGFVPHRTGHWSLPNGGAVDVATWSDGRSWLMVQATESWTESELFGLSMPFVRRVELGDGSVGYLDPGGDALAIHTGDLDVVVSGSVTREVLIATAASLGLDGLAVPDDWVEAAVLDAGDLPPGTLIPDADGWSKLGIAGDERVSVLLTGSGSRTVLITQEAGDRLDPPIGADFLAVEVRDVTGRFDDAAAALEWVEGGRIVRMQSETVGMDELVALADTMSPR